MYFTSTAKFNMAYIHITFMMYCTYNIVDRPHYTLRMLHTMKSTDLISYIVASFKLVYELPADGTDMLKHVGVVNDYTIVLLYVHLFGIINEYFEHSAWNK